MNKNNGKIEFYTNKIFILRLCKNFALIESVIIKYYSSLDSKNY